MITRVLITRTIPDDVCAMMGVPPGTQFTNLLEGDSRYLKPDGTYVPPTEEEWEAALDRMYGSWKTDRTTDEILATLRGEE